MNNLKFFAIIALGLLAATAVNAQQYNTVDSEVADLPAMVDTVTELESDAINSEQHNKWSKSTNFVKGIEAMDKASTISEDVDDDETVAYKQAITFFQKELKQHPKNGYAKCNIAMCKYRIACINLNKYILSLLNGENGQEVTSEDVLMKYQEQYEEKCKENEKDVREIIKILDEGMAMMPAADKETRCNVLIKKYEILKYISAGSDELMNCLTQATRIHPCQESYSNLVYHLTVNNHDNVVSKDTIDKYIKEATTVIPNDYQVKKYITEREYNNKNYAKALELAKELCEENPDDGYSMGIRASANIKLHNYKDAIDDVITLANNNNLLDPFTPIGNIINLDKNNNLPLALDAVREQEKKKMVTPYDVMEEEDEMGETTPVNWLLVEAQIHDAISHDYNKALECTQRSCDMFKQNGKDIDPSVLTLMGIMYYKLGKVDKALAILNDAAKKEGELSSGTNALEKMIEIESNCGMTDKAINDIQVLINLSEESNYPYCYSMLGWAYSSKGDWDNAIKAYEQWCELDESIKMAKIMKARALILSGDEDNGREIMQQVLDNGDFTGNEELKMFPLYYLGRTGESRAILDRLAANTLEVNNMTSEEKDEKEENGTLPEVLSFYDTACWYSLQGDSDNALKYLKLNYEADKNESLGFGYTILDYDFDNVRDNPEFLNIINQYKTRWLKGEYKPVK